MPETFEHTRTLARHQREASHDAAANHVIGVGPGSRAGLRAQAEERAVTEVRQARQRLDELEERAKAWLESEAQAIARCLDKRQSEKTELYTEIAQYKGDNRPYSAGSLVSLHL